MAHQADLPGMHHVEVKRPLLNLDTPALQLPTPTEEQTRALDDVFAAPREEHMPLLDAINLAAAGMLVHDIVKDTLKPADEDEDEEGEGKKSLELK